VPLVEDLLAAADPDVDLTLAGALAGTPEVGLLERALAEADASDPLEVAGTLAVGLARLRAAASGRVVARVRAACRAHLPADAAPGEVVAPRDLLEVLSTPEPASEPWGVSPPGVP
jgi:hypothetical protein